MLNGVKVLIEYLESLIGKHNVAVENNRDIVLPLYLNCYEYKVISLYGISYVFVASKESLNVKAYKVHNHKIEALFNCPAVLVLDKPKALQRQNLIENNIIFVEVGKQLFMPTIGLVLRNMRERAPLQVEKFTPQVQLCALFFLYHREGEYTAKQIAEKTKLNNMAITRGMSALEALKFVSSTSVGRTKYYRLCENEMCYLEKIEQYAISPVQKSVWVNRNMKPQNALRAGYSALSDYSMLADNEYETYAISKETYKLIEKSVQIEFEDLLDEQDYVKLEVWKYDPALFAENGLVDKFSLYMSFEHGQDERTEAILKEIKESIING
ncbi:MAG: winged helix-turn-helix transcriptional regulator [Clostridiales bacterium]|nr:winged helix-turn-helix transcriptional regulator [Clostridiales bacterium]